MYSGVGISIYLQTIFVSYLKEISQSKKRIILATRTSHSLYLYRFVLNFFLIIHKSVLLFCKYLIKYLLCILFYFILFYFILFYNISLCKFKIIKNYKFIYKMCHKKNNIKIFLQI